MTSGGRATDLYRAFASPRFSAACSRHQRRGTRGAIGGLAEGGSADGLFLTVFWAGPPMDCFSPSSGRRDRAADERERMAGDQELHAAVPTGAATAPPPPAAGG